MSKKNKLVVMKPRIKTGKKKKSSGRPPPSNMASIVTGKTKGKKSKKSAKSAVSLSLCGMRFLSGVAMPFAPESKGCCIPMLSSQPSQKETSFLRFDIAATATGTIFIYPIPCLANDGVGCIVYTTGSTATGSPFLLSASNTLSNSALAGVTTLYKFANLPYTQTQLTSNEAAGSHSITGRVVSYGVRVNYTGTTLNQSGLFYCYHSPRHENMNINQSGGGPLGINGIASYIDTDISNVSRKPCELNLYPVLPTEREYSATDVGASNYQIIYPYSQSNLLAGLGNTQVAYAEGGVNIGSPPGVIAISGLQPSAGIHVEIIQHVEYSGVLADPVATHNSAHMDDLGIVSSIVENMPAIKATHHGKGLWGIVGEAAKIAARTAKKVAIPALESGLASLLL